MNIVSRHKDSNGNILGYTIDNNGKETYVNRDTAIGMQEFISNAILTSSGDYRALKGNSIDTIVDYNELTIHTSKPNLISTLGQFNISDYYGRQYINICKKIRRYAIERKLVVDNSKHNVNNGANVHLYKLIEACGIKLDDFIISYLSTLQPYSLEDFQGNSVRNHTWIVDVGYKIKLVIKINEEDKRKPLVISFHESNKQGKFMPGKKDFSDKPCAVIVDKVNQLPNGYNVDYTIQRGFIRYSVNSATTNYANGVALVNYRDIQKLHESIIQLVFEQLNNNYYNKEQNDEPVFVKNINTEKLSFMANGFATVNTLHLLIDMYNQYTDTRSRTVIVHITDNVISEMTPIKKQELKIAMQNTFGKDKNNNLLGVINSLL